MSISPQHGLERTSRRNRSEAVKKSTSTALGPFRMVLFPDRRVPRKPRIEGEGKGHNIKAYHLTGKLSGASL